MQRYFVALGQPGTIAHEREKAASLMMSMAIQLRTARTANGLADQLWQAHRPMDRDAVVAPVVAPVVDVPSPDTAPEAAASGQPEMVLARDTGRAMEVAVARVPVDRTPEVVRSRPVLRTRASRVVSAALAGAGGVDEAERARRGLPLSVPSAQSERLQVGYQAQQDAVAALVHELRIPLRGAPVPLSASERQRVEQAIGIIFRQRVRQFAPLPNHGMRSTR
jgi:signal transduction histidine kinase